MAEYTLLHDEHRLDWALWFRALGISDLKTDTGPFSSIPTA
jgi:LysR family glycine cleavage system transcriptional activator